MKNKDSMINQSNSLKVTSEGNTIYQTNINKSSNESINFQEYLEALPNNREKIHGAISKFTYDTCPIKLIGREKEIGLLKDFLMDERTILWWAVTGMPGSGKTRLVYEFVKKYYNDESIVAKFIPWPVFSLDFNKKVFSLNNLKKDIFIVIDYMYAYESEIAEWIEWLVQHYNENKKIRILIIERDYITNKSHFSSSWESFLKYGFSNPSNIYRLKFSEKNLNLNDHQLKKEDGYSIVREYCINTNKKISEALAKHIIILCLKANNNRLSPLLLMLFTEYYLDYHKRASDKNINELVLEKMYNREIEGVCQTLRIRGHDEIILRKILVIATIVSHINIDEDLGFLELTTGLSKEKIKRIIEKYESSPLIYHDTNHSSYIEGIQPDLIGEFYVYSYFKSLKNEHIKKTLDIINEHYQQSLVGFISRFIVDNAQRLIDCEKYDIFQSYLSDDRAMTFNVINDEGTEITCEVLFTFESEKTETNYIVYTDNTTDEEGNIKVYASIYNPHEEVTKLLPIETENEWIIIQTILEKLQNGEDVKTIENMDF